MAGGEPARLLRIWKRPRRAAFFTGGGFVADFRGWAERVDLVPIAQKPCGLRKDSPTNSAHHPTFLKPGANEMTGETSTSEQADPFNPLLLSYTLSLVLRG